MLTFKQFITEKLGPDDEAEDYIRDFLSSKDPRFRGKSRTERIKMALGAYYAAKKAD